MENIIDLKEKITHDNSIEKIDLVEYEPFTGRDLDKGIIRISIQNQDSFLLPSRSHVYIEGSLVDDKGDPIGSSKPGSGGEQHLWVNLVNNAFMFLFDRVEYKLGGTKLEDYDFPGQTSTLKGLVTYPRHYNEGHKFLWIPDRGEKGCVRHNSGYTERHELIVRTYPELGTFSAVIPLSHIFGFAEYYDKVIYGMKHELVLHRSSTDNDAILKSGPRKKTDTTEAFTLPEYHIELTKLTWRMSHVKPSDASLLELNQTIVNRDIIEMPFLSRHCERYPLAPNTTQMNWRLDLATNLERPRFIILGFQTDKENDQLMNPAIFDHLNVENAHIQINNEKYPEMNLELDFECNKFTTAYDMATNYFTSKVGKDSFPITLLEYKNLYPLLVFDLSNQSEKIKNVEADVYIRAKFKEKIPKDSYVYALVLSDRMIQLQSDGNKLNVVY